jgi:hypothetical protein
MRKGETWSSDYRAKRYASIASKWANAPLFGKSSTKETTITQKKPNGSKFSFTYINKNDIIKMKMSGDYLEWTPQEAEIIAKKIIEEQDKE